MKCCMWPSERERERGGEMSEVLYVALRERERERERKRWRDEE